MKNYYEILGVERSASETEIRDRFRKLAREQHPDRYRGDDKADAETRFQVLTEAVNVLTNPARRKAHDAEIQGAAKGITTDLAQVGKAYLARGVKAWKDGDFVSARDHFDMAVKHNPDDAKALHYLALASARIPGAIRQAVQAIEGAVQKEPMNQGYLKDAGLICAKAGLPAKAERYLEEALRWDPDNSEILLILDQVRRTRGDKGGDKGEKGDGGKGLLESLFKKG